MGVTIGVDLRCLPGDGSPGAGVAHAARELTRVLVTVGSPEVSWTLFLQQKSIWDGDGSVVRLEGKGGNYLREALHRHPCDVLFVPGGAVPPNVGIPTVPWVHDVDIFSHPEWFPESIFRRTITKNLFRRGVRSSKKILAVSKYTKSHLVAKFGIDPLRVTVTGEGGDTVLASLQGKSLHAAKQRAKFRFAETGMTNPFILFLGTLEPRKNLPLLLDAWLRSRPSFSRPVDLVVTGRDGWKLRPIHHALDLTKSYANEGPSRLHRVEAHTDDDKRDLLLAADLVAIPSKSEGFGLVALEAMQAETAVVASSVGGLPEVVGSAGGLLPPGDPRLWSAAFVKLFADDETRLHVAEQGKARSQGMTWERAAKSVYDVLTGLPFTRIV